jgi:superfamily II DNA or RNA helicase
MPTGAGKTRTAMNVTAEYLRATEPTVVIWLAHSEELCEQAATEFLKAWHNIGNRELSVYRFWGEHEIDIKDVKDGFLIAGLPKFFSRTKKSSKFIAALGSKSSLVIMDEAHQAIAPSYKLVLDALCLAFGSTVSTSLLGLSATPGRTWSDAAADKELSNFFARRKVTLEIEGYDNPVDYLVKEGYLAKANYRSLMYQSGLTLSSNDRLYIQEKLDLSDQVLAKIAEDEMRNLRIILEIEQMAKRHTRIIVFAISVEHSNLLAATLKAKGIHAYSVTGNTPKTIRQKTLVDYKSDAEGCRVLCNYGVFTTGFDAPKTSAAVIARPTMSLVLYSQMVGRAIRGKRAGGNDEAEIVTVVDSSLAAFGNMAEAFNNWEDIWEK